MGLCLAVFGRGVLRGTVGSAGDVPSVRLSQLV